MTTQQAQQKVKDEQAQAVETITRYLMPEDTRTILALSLASGDDPLIELVHMVHKGCEEVRSRQISEEAFNALSQDQKEDFAARKGEVEVTKPGDKVRKFKWASAILEDIAQREGGNNDLPIA